MDITLATIGSGYNLTPLNDNMDTIESTINNELLHKTGGNNVISQSLDMDSNTIINVDTDANDPNCAANVAFVNDSVAGTDGIAVTVGLLTDNVRGSDTANVTAGNVTLTAEQSRSPFIKIINADAPGRVVTLTESADNPTNFIVQVSGTYPVTFELDTLGTTHTLQPERPYFFSYRYGVSCINLTTPIYDELVIPQNVVELSSSAGEVSIDLSSKASYYKLPLTENVTDIVLEFLSEDAEGYTIMVQITQHASSPKTVVWPASFKWAGGLAGVVSATNSAVDVLALTTFDNGATWRATLSNGFV